ncbi:MAG: Rieske 2Fe-2S domain-containing protein [Pseudomonadota bacterium]
MSDWMNIVATSDLLPGGHMVVDIDDASIVLVNLDGDYFAIENICTHDGSEIGSGCIIDGQIECPRHGARFDVKSGEVTAPPAYESIDVFPVRVVDDVVQVRDHRWD